MSDLSLYSQICRLCLVEHNLKFESIFVDVYVNLLNYERSYVKVNPNMTVPTLWYGDDHLHDSQEILEFICEKHPEKGLLPDDKEKAE